MAKKKIKYVKVSEGIVDKLIHKVFDAALKKQYKGVLKKLSKQDPKFAKDYKIMMKAADSMEKTLKNMSPDEREEYKADLMKYV